MNNLLKFAVAAVLPIIAACATSGIEAIGKPHAATDQKHLVIHNDSLAGKITISEMRTRDKAGMLDVNVTLQNLTSGDRRVQYRFTWFDSDEFEVEQGTTAWTPLLMHGAATVELRDTAPNPTVKSFKLNVREQ